MTDKVDAPTPVLNKLRRIEAENRKLRKQVEELEAGRDLMSARDVAEYLGFTTSAVTQLLHKSSGTHDQLPQPFVEFSTPTSRVWLRSQIVNYGDRMGRNRGYKPRKGKRGE